MVDFNRKLAKLAQEKVLDPQQIYDKLDRASNIGPLRPSQINVLGQWHDQFRDKRDVILKMHTGQGKTLAGLLILQSKLNEHGQPVVYLCPNNFLVEQTLAQAKQFGVNCVKAPDDLPEEFLNGQAILITSVKKLFNGIGKFKLGPQSQQVSTILVDDAHSSIEAIKSAFSIKLNYQHPAYAEILALFDSELNEQGRGSFAEIKANNRGSLLAVPYWSWSDKKNEVTGILAKYAVYGTAPQHRDPIVFTWPLLKDILDKCLCVITGTELEIYPYNPPLYQFGTYAQAKHRVFMSATIANDAFLIKGLGVSEEAIRNPLVDQDEKWSGEKMILIPSLIDPSLTESTIVNMFGQPNPKRNYGIVALTPSFRDSERWQNAGAQEAKKDTIHRIVEQLKQGRCENTVVIANRYDGIDLPDNACRILILDSVPTAQGLIERYIEERREGTAISEMSAAQTIEQGLGRAVRGDKDYCVIILSGPGLIKKVKTKSAQKFFSPQTRKQIDIGLEVTEMVSADAGSKDPGAAFIEAIMQCLRRDTGWKTFYELRMSELPPVIDNSSVLKLLVAETLAEKKYQEQNYDAAVNITQQIINELVESEYERGWYFQEMGRYIYPKSRTQSNEYQVSAHKRNGYLFKPREGMAFSKVEAIGQKRAERIIQQVRSFVSFEELSISVDELLSRLVFGIDSDIFERTFNELSKFLGFRGQRPDKEMKEGPDNLWALQENQYLLVECKNEILERRSNIYQSESGQMNNAIGWFRTNYHGAQAKHVLIHPVNKLHPGANFNESVEIMRKRELTKLKQHIKSFYAEFKSLDFDDLSEMKIQSLLNIHQLAVSNILNDYSVTPVQ